MTPRQRELARHALGLPNDRRPSYRNRFLTGGTCEDWNAMKTAGLAEAGKPDKKTGRTWFWLTRAGAEAALERGEKLCSEDFPPAKKEAPASWFDTYTRAAHRAAKLPKAWVGYFFEAVEGQGVMVTGRVVTQAITRGPRKGEPNFRTADPTTERKVFVSNKAAEAERRREKSLRNSIQAASTDTRRLGSRLNQHQKAMTAARASAEAKFRASLS